MPETPTEQEVDRLSTTGRIGKVLSAEAADRKVPGGLGPVTLAGLQGGFDQVGDQHQDRVGWSQKILVPLQEHLYVVERADGEAELKPFRADIPVRFRSYEAIRGDACESCADLS